MDKRVEDRIRQLSIAYSPWRVKYLLKTKCSIGEVFKIWRDQRDRMVRKEEIKRTKDNWITL